MLTGRRSKICSNATRFISLRRLEFMDKTLTFRPRVSVDAFIKGPLGSNAYPADAAFAASRPVDGAGTALVMMLVWFF